MNDGFHYYFRLNDKMKLILEKIEFKSKNDAIKDMHVDVKYDNQIFFGPSVIKADKTYCYKILTPNKPKLLPLILFYNIVTCDKISKSKISTLKKFMENQNEKENEILFNELFNITKNNETPSNLKNKKHPNKENLLKSKNKNKKFWFFGSGTIR